LEEISKLIEFNSYPFTEKYRLREPVWGGELDIIRDIRRPAGFLASVVLAGDCLFLPPLANKIHKRICIRE